MRTKGLIRAIFVGLILCTVTTAFSAAAPQPQSAQITKRLGTIKAIDGNTITLAPESGPETTAVVQPNARVLRLSPGEKDLKNATPIQLQDLQVGDTVRVRGYASDDAKSVPALEVIVISRAVVSAVGDQMRQDWQKRGMGGLVSAVNPATGTVTISVTSFTGKKDIAIHTTKGTVFRRYAPDSIKFEDAKAATIQEIQPGDQLRARGDRNADGNEFNAEEVVTGSFRNVAGLVNSVDASSGTVTVQDVLSKKSVQVKVTSDSQLHQIPAEMAQRIAARLKAAKASALAGGVPGSASASSTPGTSGAPSGGAGGNGPGAGANGGGPGGGMRAGGAPDFQQMLSRMPAVKLADLHKGDAVMLVTTQSAPSSASTAIMLLSGVEPILQAAPSATDAMMLTPWSLGGAPGGGDANQ